NRDEGQTSLLRATNSVQRRLFPASLRPLRTSRPCLDRHTVPMDRNVAHGYTGSPTTRESSRDVDDGLRQHCGGEGGREGSGSMERGRANESGRGFGRRVV